MHGKTNRLKVLIIICFISVPFLSSLISTFHLVKMFSLGNPIWISIILAIAIEIGAVASFLTLSILSRLNKSIVWTIFIILFMMQITGNVFFSYDYISQMVNIDPLWISTFKEMMEFFLYDLELSTVKMILSLLVGTPIPLISVFLLKSIIDYIGTDETEGYDAIPKNDIDEVEKKTIKA